MSAAAAAADEYGDDYYDEDETMSRYEYDSFRSMVVNAAGNDHPLSGGAGGSNDASLSVSLTGGSSDNNQSRLLPDKSSIRQFCVQLGEHLFQCTLCSKTYTHISNFSRHFLSAHHGLRQEVPCPVCCRIFTRRDNMLTHMKQVHGVTVARGSIVFF